jgi:hypothetical protein
MFRKLLCRYMNILITGSSGLIGSALTASLQVDGHTVVRLPRKPAGEGAPYWSEDQGVVALADVGALDAVVHLAGDNISQGRWTAQKKVRILESRVQGTTLLARHFAASRNKPKVFVSASAIGVYGDRGDELLDETSPPGTGFLADVGRQCEAASAIAAHAGIRVVNARFGIVLSASGGALGKMLPPFRLGLGGVLGSGRQFLSWVSIGDVVRMIRYVIETESLRGPVNLVAPNPVSNREFTRTLGQVLRRPTLLAMPAFAARWAFGEMADEALLSSSRVQPKKMLDSGYEFLHPDLASALEALLQ